MFLKVKCFGSSMTQFYGKGPDSSLWLTNSKSTSQTLLNGSLHFITFFSCINSVGSRERIKKEKEKTADSSLTLDKMKDSSLFRSRIVFCSIRLVCVYLSQIKPLVRLKYLLSTES